MSGSCARSGDGLAHSKTRRRGLATLGALVPVLCSGCEPSPPRVLEISVVPKVVCPGDEVWVRTWADHVTGGRRTAAPPPREGPETEDFVSTTTRFYDETRFQICEPTTWDVALWNGTEGECGGRTSTLCTDVFASVLVGAERRTITLGACSGRDRFSVDRVTDSPTIVVESVINCSSRNVTLSHTPAPPDRTPPVADTAGPGEPFAGFSGRSWNGVWDAARVVWPGEECPDPGDTGPGPPVTPPPPICLEFTLGCPATDACG